MAIIITGGKCHSKTFLSDRTMPRMKRFIKAVPSSMLTASRCAMPDQNRVHRRLRPRCNMMSLSILNVCSLAVRGLGNDSLLKLFFYSGGISAKCSRLTPVSLSWRDAAVCIFLTDFPFVIPIF